MDKFVLLLAENPKDIIRQPEAAAEEPVQVPVVLVVAAVANERNLHASVSCSGMIPSILLNFKKKLTCSVNCVDMTMLFAYMTFFVSTMNSL
jgi:hypothetical protein